jgi:hypothetical protein
VNPIYFVLGYVVLTFLFWLGNRNVKIKKPRNSAIKWLLWTTTWISFSLILIDLPAGERTFEGVFGPALISPFVYPMLFTRGLPAATMIVIAIAPVLAAWLGYVLAKRHNAARVDPNAPPVVVQRRVDYSDIGA